MSDDRTTVQDLRAIVAEFVSARDWEQFHNPKDLAAAIAVEAAELQALFLWRSADDAASLALAGGMRMAMKEELADVIILCLSLANAAGVDVSSVVRQKVEANGAKYPVELSRGSAAKYTELRDGGE
jgi:dCTP diphosphatase